MQLALITVTGTV